MLEHSAPAEPPPAGPLSLRLALGLDRLHAIPQLREHLRFGPELGGDREPQLDLLGHRPVRPEEVPRPPRMQAAPRQKRGQAVDARPVVHAVDQVVLHRVGSRVDQLVHHGAVVNQPHYADLLRGPEVLPPTSQRDALRQIAARLGLPVLAVRAGKREPLSDDDAVRFRALVPHASVVTVPGAGHLVARDQPERLALALGDFLGSDAVRDRRISRFVALAGGAAIAHPGGTLEQHLHRTAASLRAWGAPSVLVDAGRLHAAYGTDGFARALVGELDRHVIEKIVGLPAEQLIWQYGRCNRARSYPTWHTSAPQLFDRRTGNADDLTDEQRAMLIELTIANELDVLAHDPELARLHGASLRQLFARWAALASPGAGAAVAAMPG